MANEHHKPDDVVAKLRWVDVLQSQGMVVVDAIRQIGVPKTTFYIFGRLSRCKGSEELAA